MPGAGRRLLLLLALAAAASPAVAQPQDPLRPRTGPEFRPAAAARLSPTDPAPSRPAIAGDASRPR